MNENHKFEQIWGFRRNTDSSSDDSKSNSDVGKGQEKLMLIPNLVSPENDGVSETDNRHVEIEKKPKRTRKTPKKENKNTKKEVKSKPKKDSCVSSNIKKVGNNSRKNKSKFISQMTVSDDFRIFTESILDDLRVARETMFAKMRKEMDQLVNIKPSSRSTKKRKITSNPTKKPTQKPRARKPAKPKQKTELASSKDQNPPQEQVKNENTNDPSSKNPILVDSSAKKTILFDSSAKKTILFDSSAKNPILFDSPAKNPILIDPSAKNSILIDSSAKNPILIDSSAKNSILIDSSAKKPIFTNTPDQIATSSAYLTIPLGQSNSRSNDTSLKLERGNYSGFDFGHNNIESSCAGNGYQIGLNHHQIYDNSNNFGIPNRVVQGYSHDGSLLGTRMMNGGGIRYTSGLLGPTLPSHLASNGFRSLYPN